MLFPKIVLQIKEVLLHAGNWLSDALDSINEVNIPTNTILDKTITGIGATSMELKAERDSIIIEPTLPVIHDKAKDKPFLPVYQGCTVGKIKDYLLNEDIRYKKLLTTPESFWKVKKACIELGTDIYQRFFCLFDECEKLTQDTDYRKKITKPMKAFFQFQGKAFVSATPLKVSDPRFEGFQTIKIIPDYDYKEDLKLIITNNYYCSVKELLLETLQDSPCIFIFLNTTDGINRVIDTLGIKKQSKIFCSDDSVAKLKGRGFINVESQFQEPLAKYNFMTCRFYSALDINLDILPDVVMLTDLYEAEHSMIDPFTETIQIQGRFRKKFRDGKRFSSLTHISNVRNQQNVRTEEELDAELSVYQGTYNSLQERYGNAQDPLVKKAILRDMDRANFTEFINKDDEGNTEIDYFAIDNYYNSELVKSYYQTRDTLREAYERCKYFNIEVETPFYVMNDWYRLNLKQHISFAKRCKAIIALLENNKDNLDQLHIELLKDIHDFEFIFEIYTELGSKIFEEKKYQRAKIKKALKKVRVEKKRFCPELLEAIKEKFPLNQSLEQKGLKEELQKFYKRFGIEYKVKINTIEDYFEVSPSYYNKPYTYTLKAWNPIR